MHHIHVYNMHYGNDRVELKCACCMWEISTEGDSLLLPIEIMKMMLFSLLATIRLDASL